uniref:Uncharacterized protein n=1 Tax=Rhizophora mucronata TaxID=61149 RepID=A0A2P2R4I2_RHIMU
MCPSELLHNVEGSNSLSWIICSCITSEIQGMII